MQLTPEQRARWGRTRQRGQRRAILEQALCWILGVGMGGPTLRHFLREGALGARQYWSGTAGVLHFLGAVAFGSVMTYVVAVAMWNRMERGYAASSSEAPEPRSDAK
jgi:hypothetical protein